MIEEFKNLGILPYDLMCGAVMRSIPVSPPEPRESRHPEDSSREQVAVVG